MKIATSELEHLREEVKNCHRIIKDLQKREFVGLTDDEIDAIIPEADGTAEADKVWVKDGDFPCYEYDEVEAWSKPLLIQIIKDIDAKLKQKNGYAEEKNT